MRHGKHVPQGDGKRDGKERKREEKSTKCPKCPTVPLYQISNKNCNKKDNILINNDLDKIHNSIWDSGTVGHLGHFCKDFSNSYRFAYKLDIAALPSPAQENHTATRQRGEPRQDADRNAGHRFGAYRQCMKPTDAGKRVLKRQKPMVYGQQNTHIGMKTHRVIIEEQRKVTVKKQLVTDDKYTAFFCHFSSLHTNILSKPTFSITLHLFSPTCGNTPETATSQHTCLLADRQGTRDMNQDK